MKFKIFSCSVFISLLIHGEVFPQKNKMQTAIVDTQVYIIPVVFHILHNYGIENISDAQVIDAINILNRDFRKLNPDTIDIIPPFKSLAADIRIEFRLAKKDPYGNCTNGIDRIATTRTYSADDSAKLNPWNPLKYFNVWVVHSIANNGVAVISSPPPTITNIPVSMGHGLVILFDYLGSIGTSSITKSRILTFNLGNYLGLRFNFTINSNCGDDGISNTPLFNYQNNCNNLYPYSCTLQTLDTFYLNLNYTFIEVITNIRNTDPSEPPATLGLNYSSFMANGVSANSLTNGAFAFSNWELGSNNGELNFSNLSGQLDTAKFYEFTIYSRYALCNEN